MVPAKGVATPKFWGVLMSTLKRLAALTHTTANLIVQLRELNELREQVRKAELSARSSRPISRRKITFNNERRRRDCIDNIPSVEREPQSG
jgi:hypothetical protein